MDSKKKRKLNSNNTIGFTRVGKNGKRFTSKIRVESKKKYLGTHETAKAAALAYDRAVIDHKLASSGSSFLSLGDFHSSSGDVQ